MFCNIAVTLPRNCYIVSFLSEISFNIFLLVFSLFEMKSRFAPVGFALAVFSANLFVTRPARAGAWNTNTALTTARTAHTATVLTNGQVLAAGGRNGGVSIGGAEVYNPIAKTWTPTGSMSGARQFHTATLLANGKVLAAAGLNLGIAYINTAELYDPALQSWSAAGALNTARDFHTATLLPSGKVPVAGGRNSSTAFTSAELCDPSLDF